MKGDRAATFTLSRTIVFVLLFAVISIPFSLFLGNRPCPLIWIPVASATEGEAPLNCWEELGTLGVLTYLVVIAVLSYGVSTLVRKGLEVPLLPVLVVITGALSFVLLGPKISFVILVIVLSSVTFVKSMPILEEMLQ